MFCYRCHSKIKPSDEKYGLHKECFVAWFSVDPNEEFQDLIARSAGSNEMEIFKRQELISSFFQGKFKKYSAQMGQKTYLLKVMEDSYEELPATEYLCNQIAKLLNLDIPNFYFILFESLPTFICENFMQSHHAANLVHIYHFLDESSEYNCETLYKIILDKTQRIYDAHRLVHTTLFDALIGNHDRHGRNIALIQSSKGYRLSPIYDNPSYLGIESDFLLAANHEPRGKIATTTTVDPTLKDYVKEWQRLQLNEIVLSFYKNIDLDKIFALIQNSYISDKRKSALKRLVQKRYQELSDALIE